MGFHLLSEVELLRHWKAKDVPADIRQKLSETVDESAVLPGRSYRSV